MAQHVLLHSINRYTRKQSAIKIVNSAIGTDPISKVFVRLGGFHLLMSFLGTIGCLMSGSGLEDVLEVIYAKNSLVHIMNGHAYERAIRAHFLIHMVLTKLIIQGADLKDDVEKNKELSESRKQRDYRDQDLLMEFFETHNTCIRKYDKLE